MSASTIGSCLRRAFCFELVPRFLFRSCTILPLIAFPAYFVYRINFQRPKRYVSVGALDEVKPDVEGLGRLHQVLNFIHQGEVDATLKGGVFIDVHTRSHVTVDTCIPTNPGRSRSGFH